MLTDAQREYLAVLTRTLQIIVATLAFGVLMFAGIAIVVASNMARAGGGPDLPILTYLAAGAALLALVMSWIVPGIIAANQRQAIAAGKAVATAYAAQDSAGSEELGDVQPLAVSYQTQQIVRAAILEGAAFMCLVFYIFEMQPLSLVAAGILVLFLISQFPTRLRVEDWIEGEMAAVEQLRQMGTVDAR